MFGSQDNLVPVSIAKSFQKKMKDLSNICQLIIYDGAKHGFFNGVRDKLNSVNANRAKYFFDTLQASDDFLVNLNIINNTINVKDYFE